jgi:hypothetical protein
MDTATSQRFLRNALVVALSLVSIGCTEERKDSAQARKPYWSGWWWPGRDHGAGDKKNLYDPGGPLDKYWAFVQHAHGPNLPEPFRSKTASQFERELGAAGGLGHFCTRQSCRMSDSEDFCGHCNGWSVASMMETEPTSFITKTIVLTTVESGVLVTRPPVQIVFSPADLKGLLSEMWYRTDPSLKGAGDPSGPKDVTPLQFHGALQTFQNGAPVGMDIAPGAPIWNYPVYRFERVAKKNTLYNKDRISFTTTVTYTDAAPGPDYSGPMREIKKIYRYTIDFSRTPGDHGTWDDKERPGAVWLVPEGAKPQPPNAAVTAACVKRIINGGNETINVGYRPDLGAWSFLQWPCGAQPQGAPQPVQPSVQPPPPPAPPPSRPAGPSGAGCFDRYGPIPNCRL